MEQYGSTPGPVFSQADKLSYSIGWMTLIPFEQNVIKLQTDTVKMQTPCLANRIRPGADL